jgi:WXXGXW repeat (2 copies)
MTTSKHMSLKGLLFAVTILPGPLILGTPAPAAAQIGVVVSVQLAPPELPVYEQPPMPEVGYVWTPGFWQWDASTGYYWVPGTWIQPPTVGVLWTPPYWGWSDGLYIFHGGYWGPHVGFYGGVNYGYGYGGSGYEGGRWEGGRFAYNQSVNNFGSVHVENAYRQNVTVINNTHTSFAGGPNGVKAEPTAGEREAERDRHVPPTADQTRHIAAAAGNPAFAAKNNNGHPAIAATARPGQFEGAGGGGVRPPAAGGRPELTRPGAGRPEVAGHPGQPEVPHPAGAAEPRATPHLVAPARPEVHAAPPRAAPLVHAAPPPRAAPMMRAAPPPRAAPPRAAPPRAAPPRAAPPHAAPPRAAPPHAAPAHEEKKR